MTGRRPLAVVQTQPVHTADHRAAYAPTLATAASADRAVRAEPHVRHGGARTHHRVCGRRGGNAHVRGRAGRVFGGARGVRIHDHRFRHGAVVGVRDRDHRGVWRFFAGDFPRQDHCGGADVHWYCVQVNLETDRREDAREKEVAKEAAQEAIAAVAAKARVPEGTKRAAAPGSAAAMPPSPEIELLREEVRELAAMVAGLHAELERR
mgnify:CR=1 FL=1